MKLIFLVKTGTSAAPPIPPPNKVLLLPGVVTTGVVVDVVYPSEQLHSSGWLSVVLKLSHEWNRGS